MSSAGHMFDVIRRIDADFARERGRCEQAERTCKLCVRNGRTGVGNWNL